MKFGRQDRLAEALDVEGWPIFFNRVGKGIEPFSGRGFEGSTRFLNHDNVSRPNASLNSMLPRTNSAAVLLALFRAQRAQSCCFPMMRAYLYLVIDPSACIGCRACLKACPLKG